MNHRDIIINQCVGGLVIIDRIKFKLIGETTWDVIYLVNQIIKDVTGVAGGVIFENRYTYNARLGANVDSENRQSSHEWVLKPDTTYLVRMTQTAFNCKMTIDLHFYEHSDKSV